MARAILESSLWPISAKGLPAQQQVSSGPKTPQGKQPAIGGPAPPPSGPASADEEGLAATGPETSSTYWPAHSIWPHHEQKGSPCPHRGHPWSTELW